jgi:hypothetical protein
MVNDAIGCYLWNITLLSLVISAKMEVRYLIYKVVYVCVRLVLWQCRYTKAASAIRQGSVESNINCR